MGGGQIKSQSGQKKFNPDEIQNRIFRQMSAEKKLEVLQGFIEFAKILQKIGGKNGSKRYSQKIGTSP